jgi:hypothetical protein
VKITYDPEADAAYIYLTGQPLTPGRDNGRKRVGHRCRAHRRRTSRRGCRRYQLAVLEFPAWARIRAAGLEHAVLAVAEHGGLRAVDSLIDRPPAEYEQHLARQSLVA